ncbi:MAG: alpha/beta fold hydrolase [Cyclobacteriaceae bacterium]|nr:alpha/beta fold hydrolase [Cyclobacteriaceae bacterium]
MNQLLNYKILGEGQPLIILHGLFGSLDNWMTLGKRFAQGFKVVLVDQRNHGKSFHDYSFSYSVMADDLKNLIEHLKLEQPILIGHSMGGKTVMQYLAFNPTEVKKLIVADIGPKSYPVHHESIINGLKKVSLSNIQLREEVDIQLGKYIPDLGTRTFLMKNLSRTSDGRFEWKMNLDVISDNIEEVGKSLDYYLPLETPCLFIRGSDSSYILDEDLDGIMDIFPEARLETINGSGHWLHADNPQKFFELVTDFISV